jgi:hypothetical protein
MNNRQNKRAIDNQFRITKKKKKKKTKKEKKKK